MQKFHLGLSQIPHSPSMEEEHSSSSMSILSTPFLETPRKTPSKPNKRTIVTTLMEAATFTSSSFKEDTYFISNLKSSEKKALKQLKEKLLASDEITNNGSMWGVCLIKGDDVADVLLLKFLRARDFRVNDAYTMLVKCLSWRKEFGAENVVDEDLGFKELEGVVAFTHGFDREGHPVCYNHYGVFKDKEMYERVFGDEEKLKKFLRWRVQVLERGIKLLQFKPGGVNSLIQVTDLKDMPKSELRVVSNQIMSLFQDNYPEMVARKIFINVPWYFSMLYSMFSPFLTQRTKSKFVISKEGNAAETLYKFIRPENIPIQYGGLSRPSDFQNGPPKLASEFTVKGGEKVNIQIEGVESGATIKWEIVVGGWDLEYSAEFVPNAEASYTIEVEKARKVNASEEAIQNSYTSKEAGIMVLSVDNSASRKKKVAAYRYFVRKYNSNTPSDMQLSLKIK
ncbi:patellin-6 [Medicago truncatula]|nr:patellin-6 [Medicago truncatula]